MEKLFEGTALDEQSKVHQLIGSCSPSIQKILRQCESTGAGGLAEAWKILHRRYGTETAVLRATYDMLGNGRAIDTTDADQLEEIASELLEAANALEGTTAMYELNSRHIVKELSVRFPRPFLSQYSSRASLDVVDSELKFNFRKFCEFVWEKSIEARDGVDGILRQYDTQKSGHHNSTKRDNGASKGRKDTSTDASKSSIQSCPCCDEAHGLYRCQKFKDKDPRQMKNFLKKKKLCFNCFSPSHDNSKCPSKFRCQADGCNRRHNTLIHDTYETASTPLENKSGGNPIESKQTNVVNGAGAPVRCQVVPVLVRHAESSTMVSTYAYLDEICALEN
jgi:hypothetical protein